MIDPHNLILDQTVKVKGREGTIDVICHLYVIVRYSKTEQEVVYLKDLEL